LYLSISLIPGYNTAVRYYGGEIAKFVDDLDDLANVKTFLVSAAGYAGLRRAVPADHTD
jgi:hypothetical protein